MSEASTSTFCARLSSYADNATLASRISSLRSTPPVVERASVEQPLRGEAFGLCLLEQARDESSRLTLLGLT